MGQNETAHLHDASVGSGPLWCVPVTAGVIAVWHNLPSEFELIGVAGGAGLLTQIERHRIFSPQCSKNFYTVSSHGLQEGRRHRVILRRSDGVEIEQGLDLRLAHWQIEGTPQIVSFIISRLLPKLDASSDHETLERFLSLVSSWRASCRASAQIGSHSFFNIDVAARHFAQRQVCFVMRAGRLTRETLGSFGHDDGSTFMASRSRPDRAYADLGGDLVELEFSHEPVTEKDTLQWVQSLSMPAKNALLDQLSAASNDDPALIPAYVTASLKTAECPLGEPEAQIAIEGCFQASGRLFAFVEIAGAQALEDMRIELFGAPASQHVMPDLLTCSLPSDGPLPKSRIVAQVSLDDHRMPACKIIAHVDGQSIQQWIHIQAGGTGFGLGFVRDFWPLADRDERYLTEVGAPFARAWARRPVTEPAQVISLSGRRDSGSPVDLQIVAGAQLDPLHGTLLAIKSSIPRSQAVRVTLSSAPEIGAACSTLSEWAKRYDLEGEVNAFSVNAPPSAAAGPNARSSAHVYVAVRAGFIPPGAGWLEEIANHIVQAPDAVLVGLAPSRRPNRFTDGKLTHETLLELLARDAIIGLAASADLMARIAVEQPTCHTLAGSWVERILDGLSRGAKAIPHAALGFLEMDVSQDQDAFGARVDEISLFEKAAAAEYREAPRRPGDVVSA